MGEQDMTSRRPARGPETPHLDLRECACMCGCVTDRLCPKHGETMGGDRNHHAHSGSQTHARSHSVETELTSDSEARALATLVRGNVHNANGNAVGNDH